MLSEVRAGGIEAHTPLLPHTQLWSHISPRKVNMLLTEWVGPHRQLEEFKSIAAGFSIHFLVESGSWTTSFKYFQNHLDSWQTDWCWWLGDFIQPKN